MEKPPPSNILFTILNLGKMRYVFIILTLFLSNLAFSQIEKEIYENVITEYVSKLRQPNIDYSKGIVLVVLDSPANMRKVGIEEYTNFKGKV
jgi:hypothetical protein